MEAIKAIETEYNGYLFRSRLEARWAVFFDKVCIKYEYEPEGYELEDGTRYLPDFYLPELDMHVEVKGDPETGEDEIKNKSLKFVGSDSPITRLLILTNVPTSEGINCHPVIEYYPLVNSYMTLWGYFRALNTEPVRAALATLPFELVKSPDTYVTTKKLTELLSERVLLSQKAIDDIEYVYTYFARTKIIGAYNAARQARFEFQGGRK